jgi:hypothetical protein
VALSALAPNDIWAVGYYYPGYPERGRTLTMHWDGQSWTLVPSPNVSGVDSSLHAVAAIASDDVWAVGHTGTVGGGDTGTLTMHWDGQSWTLVPSPNPGPAGAMNTLNGVSASGSDDVWAVGGYTNSFGGPIYPLVLRWQGSAWSVVQAPGPGDGGTGHLMAVEAVAPNWVWAVGVYGSSTYGAEITLVLKWNGSTWSTPAGSTQAGSLNGITAVGPGDLWAVGRTPSGQTLAMRWTGGLWTTVPTGGITGQLYGVSGIPGIEVWAAGYKPSAGGNLTMRWDGTSWTEYFVPGHAGYLRSIVVPSANNAWTVGPWVSQERPSPLFHYNDPCITPTPTATPTACAIAVWFADVPPTNTFYPFVRCLACKLIVSGYPCGGVGEPCDPESRPFFRPNNPVTRRQVAKIVSESAQFYDPVPPSQQTFADVPYDSPFWLWVERLAGRGIMSGYPCGGQGEPCDSQNRPYFRPNTGATRGQLTKIVSEAAGFLNIVPDTQQTFTDAPPGSTFWVYVERLLSNRPGVMAGYPCGSPGEPCDSVNRPYFRPNNGVTRGQTSKIVANTFFPGCSPLRR